MAKDTWPDLSTRQGFIEAIEQAGEYIRDHASNLLGEYPSLLCEFDITARFRFDAVPTVEIRREHIAAPLDEYQQRRAYGATWEQDGVCLYDVLDRVSCWCCRNKNQRELRAIHDHLPRYWQQLLALESRLGTMKSKPLPEIAGA